MTLHADVDELGLSADSVISGVTIKISCSRNSCTNSLQSAVTARLAHCQLIAVGQLSAAEEAAGSSSDMRAVLGCGFWTQQFPCSVLISICSDVQTANRKVQQRKIQDSCLVLSHAAPRTVHFTSLWLDGDATYPLSLQATI